MISTILFIILYTVLCAIYLWFGVNHEKRAIKLILKCLPLVVLILWYVLQWMLKVGLCQVTDKDNGLDINGEFNVISLCF